MDVAEYVVFAVVFFLFIFIVGIIRTIFPRKKKEDV